MISSILKIAIAVALLDSGKASIFPRQHLAVSSRAGSGTWGLTRAQTSVLLGSNAGILSSIPRGGAKTDRQHAEEAPEVEELYLPGLLDASIQRSNKVRYIACVLYIYLQAKL